jgi:hypothetical protein
MLMLMDFVGGDSGHSSDEERETLLVDSDG